MPKFSEKYGYSSVEKAFQREVLSDGLRVAIWNILKITIWDRYDFHNEDYSSTSKEINLLIKRIWIHFLNRDLDKLPRFRGNEQGSYAELKKYFYECDWFKAYDFLEFIVIDATELLNSDAINWINNTLEKHNAAYRIVETSVVEITDENEIEAIEVALNHPEKPVREHLNSALNKLSDKEVPDYRNSIKESISAVEAACRILTDNKSATLSDALKKVNNLHPAMKQAFDKLYGYTSDASGVRHSLLDETTITYADAKFMLVTCSAFVSYLNTNLSKS
jgi:soluble cytochrome b562